MLYYPSLVLLKLLVTWMIKCQVFAQFAVHSLLVSSNISVNFMVKDCNKVIF